MANTTQGNLNAGGLRFAIVLSRFNGLVTQRLLEGALDALTRTGAADGDIDVFKVPGSFEIPLAAKKVAGTGKYHAVVCLGTLIQGETPHFTYLCSEVAKGVATVALDSEVPVVFGVVTAESGDQAMDRAGLKSGNKGFEAALSAVEMANLLRQIG